jgi:outer membrane protein, heavy metal efflux system
MPALLRALTAIAFACTSVIPALAQTSERLVLSEVIAEARDHNPDIKAARDRVAAAKARPAQVSAYDDPMVSYEAWNAPESFRVDHADNNIFRLSQKIPFPGKRSLAGTMAARDADMAEQNLRSVELDAVASATKAYYDLWMVHQNILIYSRDKDLVERFAKIAEQKYAVGQVSQPDVLRAQVELTRLINRVTTETLAADGARAALNALLSRADDEPLGVPEGPPPPALDVRLDDLVALALERRPERVAQQAAIAREENALRLAKLNYLPDFELSAGRFVNYRARDGVGAMVSVSIPIAYKGKYDAALSEAEARLSAAKNDLRRVDDAIRREVKQAFVGARTALEQRNLFVSTHIPQAELALRGTQSGYETGKVDFLSLIDSIRAIEWVHVEHIQAAAAFEKSFADLKRAVAADVLGKTGR